MNSRQLWNSHQRHKFLRAKSSRDILAFPGDLKIQEVFSTADTMLFRQNTHNTGSNVIEMLQAFYVIARLKLFTDLNLFKYAFNVIQNWNTDALFDSAYFLLAVMVEGDESSQLRMVS